MTEDADRAAATHALDILRHPAVPAHERERAFEAMLALDSGWWGKGRLVVFASAVALRQARTQLGRGNEGRIDWESLAIEALLVLFTQAQSIHGSPRSWLWGVVRNLVNQEIRRFYPEVVAVEVTEKAPAPESEADADDDATVSARERREREQQDRLLTAIMRLPASLRIVAQLYFIERLDRDEICVRLGISAITLRKRLERMRRMLQAGLE